MAEKQGVLEKLKAEKQLKWVALMNNIKAQAEEIVCTKIIFVRNTIYISASKY